MAKPFAHVAFVLLTSIANGCASSASAADSSAALVDAGDAGLRGDLAWLADRGVIDLRLGTWPLPLAVVNHALEKVRTSPATPADLDALDRVRTALSRQTAAAFGWRVNSARHPSIGDDGAGRAEQTAYAQIGGGDDGRGWAWRLRGNAQARPIGDQSSGVTLDGSYVAAAVGGAIVSLEANDRWWGPARYGSPILGNAAPPVPAIAVRRASDEAPASRWLAWLGPWNYELLVGRPSGYEPRGANTIGIRLSARPVAGVEVGLSRYIYWGGNGRSKSLGSLRDALLGDSNIDDPATQGPDPSNEIAGVDVRWSVPVGQATWIGYGHFVGEDEADAAPSKLMATLGLQLKQVVGAQRLEWTAESSDTRLGRLFGFGNDNQQTGYQHGTFVDGHYHRGLPVGAFIGGGGLVYSLGLALVPTDSAAKLRYEARVWSAKASEFDFDRINAAYGTSAKARGVLVQTSGETALLRWNVGVSVQRYDAPGRRTAGVLAAIELPLPAW